MHTSELPADYYVVDSMGAKMSEENDGYSTNATLIPLATWSNLYRLVVINTATTHFDFLLWCTRNSSAALSMFILSSLVQQILLHAGHHAES